MKVLLNGAAYETSSSTMSEILHELALEDAVVATAINGQFVAKGARSATCLEPGDAIEVLAPMQGG